MSYKEICFLIYTPLTKRDHQRFGFDRLRDRGYVISVIDLTNLLNPRIGQETDLSGFSNRLNIVKINKKDEFLKYFKDKTSCFVIDWIGCSYRTVFIYKLFKQMNISFGVPCTNAVPIPAVAEWGLAGRIKKIFKKLLLNDLDCGMGIKERIGYLWYLAMPKGLFLQAPRFIFAGGQKYPRKLPWLSKKTKIIPAHSLDYDIFLEDQAAVETKKNYAVFLDEYFPFHPDFLVHGFGGIDLEPNAYYRGINSFFTWFEKKSGMEVIIAAHPSSQYDLKKGCFPEEKLRKGNTSSLVRGSSCVIAHGSTAIGFAVLYKKPIIILTSNDINKTRYGSFFENYALQFKQRPINVDLPGTFESGCKFEVDEGCYQKYISNYIKSPGSPEKNFWDIVADSIEKGTNI